MRRCHIRDDNAHIHVMPAGETSGPCRCTQTMRRNGRQYVDPTAHGPFRWESDMWARIQEILEVMEDYDG